MKTHYPLRSAVSICCHHSCLPNPKLAPLKTQYVNSTSKERLMQHKPYNVSQKRRKFSVLAHFCAVDSAALLFWLFTAACSRPSSHAPVKRHKRDPLSQTALLPYEVQILWIKKKSAPANFRGCVQGWLSRIPGMRFVSVCHSLRSLSLSPTRMRKIWMLS